MYFPAPVLRRRLHGPTARPCATHPPLSFHTGRQVRTHRSAARGHQGTEKPARRSRQSRRAGPIKTTIECHVDSGRRITVAGDDGSEKVTNFGASVARADRLNLNQVATAMPAAAEVRTG